MASKGKKFRYRLFFTLMLCWVFISGFASVVSAETDSCFGAGAILGVEQYGANLGIGWSRVPIDINEYNYNDAQYLKAQGQYIGPLQQLGIMPYVVINPRKQSTWLSAANFAAAVGTIVESFDKDGNGDASGLLYPVYTYELINEYSSQGGMDYPELNQETFVAMFSQAEQAARTSFSECQIAYDPFNESDAQSLLDTIGADGIDIISYHTYSPLDYPENTASPSYFPNFKSMLGRLKIDGTSVWLDKPVWVTEYACYDHYGMIPPPSYQAAGDQIDNARWLVQTVAWGLGSGFFEKIIYTEIQQPQDAFNDARLAWMTLLDSSQNKRPNYYAYQRLIALIDHFASVKTLSLGDNIYAYAFTKSDGQVVDVLWSKESNGTQSNVQISGLGDGEVTLKDSVPDESGNFTDSTQEITQGVLTIESLSEEPVYVILSASQANPPELPEVPSKPANLQVAAKSSTQVIITWDESSSATGIKEYVIEMKSGNGEYVEIATPTNASYTVTGLVSGSMYTFRVLAVEGSSSGVVSDWSDELIVTLDEEDHCFIATAAFGSKFIWPVALLRHFRDQYLLTNSWGKTFVNYYYRNSPPVAAVIAKSKPLKLLVRVILAPVIAVVYMICHPLLASAILFSLIILALIYFNFKRRCLRANA